MPPRRMFQVAAVLVAIASSTTGCVGYLVGYGIDVGTKQVVVPTHPDSVDFGAGKKVRVLLKNGERVTARIRPEPGHDNLSGIHLSTVALVSSPPI